MIRKKKSDQIEAYRQELYDWMALNFNANLAEDFTNLKAFSMALDSVLIRTRIKEMNIILKEYD